MRSIEESPHLAEQSTFAGHLQMQVLALEPDRAAVTLPLRPEVLTEGGGVARGAVCALVEAAGTAAGVGGLEYEKAEGGTADLVVSFPRPAPAQPLTAEARVMSREGGLCLCEVTVSDWNGALVAKGHMTYRSGESA